jgi:NADH-quinone oxidoreductase subunit M
MPILSFIIWLPIFSLFVLCLFPGRLSKAYRGITVITTCLQVIAVSQVIRHYVIDLKKPVNLATGYKLIENFTWFNLPLGNLGSLNIKYIVGVDGWNMGLLAMFVLVLLIAAIASWNINQFTKAYFSLFLILDTLVLGSILALDFLLFYIFFELTLIPIYFLIGIWGGKESPKAATQFFLYTLLGAMCIFMVIIWLALAYYDPIATGIQAGILKVSEAITPAKLCNIQAQIQNGQIPCHQVIHSLDFRILNNPAYSLPHASLLYGKPRCLLSFLGLVIGFGIKLGTVPFHSWLPKAHVAAPTPISILLSAILLKVAGYGLLRTAYSIFPEATLYANMGISIMGLVSILYGALNAVAMKDMKRMLAYASIAHMGFFLLGLGALNEEGLQGALYQLISHGLITALLFLIVGILEDRTQDRNVENYSGLATMMPGYAILGCIGFIAAMGVPSFSTFIAELLILLGTFHAHTSKPWVGILTVVGIFLNTIYLIWTIQRLLGSRRALQGQTWKTSLKDLTRREYCMLLLIIAIIVILGICPHLILCLSQSKVKHLVNLIHTLGQTN